MKKKTQPLKAPAVNSDGMGNDELVALERPPLADHNDPNYLDLTRVLKELEADTQAMLNDIWSDDNERIEKLLAALNEDDEELLTLRRHDEEDAMLEMLLATLNDDDERLTRLPRSDEEDEKLVEKLLAELNEEYEF